MQDQCCDRQSDPSRKNARCQIVGFSELTPHSRWFGETKHVLVQCAHKSEGWRFFKVPMPFIFRWYNNFVCRYLNMEARFMYT